MAMAGKMEGVTVESTQSGRAVLTLRRAAIGVCVLAAAWIGSGLEDQTWPPTLVVLAVVIPVGLLSFRRPVSPVPGMVDTEHPLRRSVVFWSVLLTAGLIWEAYAFFNQPSILVGSWEHPTLSELLHPVFEFRSAKFVGWVLWIWAGLRMARP